jgi:hypothetical protein
MSRPCRRALLLPVCLLLLACPGAGEIVSVEANEDCEWLLPGHCPLPWPSNRFTVADPTTETGLRLAYRTGTMPETANEEPFDPEPWNRFDGFSPSGTILAAFEKPIDVSNLPGHANIGDSLSADSPTVLIDASTGERVAHWAEIDAGYEDPAEALLYIRAAARLNEATRYVVALRDLRFDDGEAPVASEAFRALRDGLDTDAPLVEARRETFEEIFEILETAGIERSSLQLAWDFTTASGEVLRRDMVHMRDDALDRIGPGGIGCTVTNVTSPYNQSHARIEGTFTVPSYMTHPRTLARLVRDDDGLPVFQEMTEVHFVAIVPSVLAEDGATPGGFMTYGHGLMGSRGEATGGAPRRMAEEHEVVVVATDWAGMSNQDIPAVTAALVDVSQFGAVADRLHQGMLHQLVLTRTMAGACTDAGVFDVDGNTVVDPEKLYWLGISQGGIFGATVMALSTDIERGVLHVGGSNYAMMIERSSNYRTYEEIFSIGYPNRMDRHFLWGVMQQLWDHTDPVTWLPNLERDPLPGTPAKQTLYSIALHDAQVSNLSSDFSVRTAGFPLLTPTVVEPWGIETVANEVSGSAYVIFDVGDPPMPETNVTPEGDPGGHGRMRHIDEHLEMVDGFFREGVIRHPCGTAPCVFSP